MDCTSSSDGSVTSTGCAPSPSSASPCESPRGDDRWPPAWGEAALPLYILYVPFVTAIPFFVVRSPLDFWPKVLVNLVLGVAVSVIVAVAAVRVAFLRPLLGLRPAPPATRATRAVGAEARS